MSTSEHRPISDGKRERGRFFHGQCNTPEYSVWKNMMTRCYNPRVDNYAYYGGRGIRVDDRWSSFAKFIEDLGPRPTVQHTLDRINNDGPYAPGNCRWATKAEQGRNQSSNRVYTFAGYTFTTTDWAHIMQMAESTLRKRLKLGWTLADALTVPVVRHSSRYVRSKFHASL